MVHYVARCYDAECDRGHQNPYSQGTCADRDLVGPLDRFLSAAQPTGLPTPNFFDALRIFGMAAEIYSKHSSERLLTARDFS